MDALKETIFAVGYWLSVIIIGCLWAELKYKCFKPVKPDGQRVSQSILDVLYKNE
tara:strand:- start:784 stop:948 length:165 start_codon:yes stop_codon:yes gene_type:complete